MTSCELNYEQALMLEQAIAHKLYDAYRMFLLKCEQASDGWGTLSDDGTVAVYREVVADWVAVWKTVAVTPEDVLYHTSLEQIEEAIK